MRPGSTPGPPAPATLHDVAREAGVSISTASRALNGSSRAVTEENVARVAAAATRLNYTPHLSAQAIARGATQTAALVVGDIADPYFAAIAAGATRHAEAADLTVTMAVTDRSAERELHIVRALRGQRPRAIILAGSRDDDAGTRDALVRELAAYRTAGGRVVLISQPELAFPTIAIDNTGGARALARALVERGYRRFAVLHAPRTVHTSQDRLDGFLAGLRASRARVGTPVLLETAFTRDGGYQAAARLAERGLDDVELVFAVTDVMAIGALAAFRDAGLTPGRDVGVAGFDDITPAVDVTPALTTVAVPLVDVGARAMALALSPDPEATTPVAVPTTVVLRDSTPARRRAG